MNILWINWCLVSTKRTHILLFEYACPFSGHQTLKGLSLEKVTCNVNKKKSIWPIYETSHTFRDYWVKNMISNEFRIRSRSSKHLPQRAPTVGCFFFMEIKTILLQRNFSLPAYPQMLALFLLIYLRSKKKVQDYPLLCFTYCAQLNL